MRKEQDQMPGGDDIALVFAELFHHIHKTSSIARKIAGVTTDRLNAYPYRIIGLLVREGSMPVTEIGLKLDIAKSNVSACVNKQVALGNLERIPGQVDRRVVIIDVTDKGRNEFHEAYAAMTKVIAEYFSRLTVKDRKSLIKGLSSTSAILEKLYPPQ